MKTKAKWILVFLFALGVEASGAATHAAAGTALRLEVNGMAVDVPLDTNGAVFDLPTLSREFPARFALVGGGNGLTVTVNGMSLPFDPTGANGIDVPITAIDFRERITLRVSDGNDTTTLYFRTYNSKIPAMIKAGEGLDNGDYYLSFTLRPLLLKLDHRGEILYYRLGEATLNRMAFFLDFQKHLIREDGVEKVYYSFFEQEPDYHGLDFPGFSSGTRVILDERYREVDRLYMRGKGSDAASRYVDGHDFIMLGRNHYVLTRHELVIADAVPRELRPNPLGSKVVVAVIQELKDGKVVFEWRGDAHPELFSLTEPPFNDFGNAGNQWPDVMHLNSITIDPFDPARPDAGDFVCSFRNLSTVVKIDRKSGTILWRLGGKEDDFGLTVDQKFANQHFARFTGEGTLTLFDNGVRSRQSRVLELRLDQAAKKLIDFREYVINDRFSFYYGSASKQPLADTGGDTVFVIGWGLVVDGRVDLSEINFTKRRTLFELSLPEDGHTYRILKFR